MGGEPMKCPNCGAALAHGAAFCEACGRRVDRACKPSPSASSAPCGSERQSAASQGAPADAAPFEVSAALPEAMQVGRRSLVHVRFRARADIYESVEFVLRNGDDVLARVPCCNGRPFAVEHQVSLSVTPKVCGAARVALDVRCRMGSGCDEEIHTASLDVAVDDKNPTSFSPVFNINQNQTSDRAGDTKGDVNVNFGGLQIAPLADVSRYETPASFVVVCPSLRKSPSRLTLKGRSGVVQLLSDDLVSFGRNRDNTIPLRVFGGDGKIDLGANENNISRFHFRIVRNDGDCLVFDGGCPNVSERPRPSAYGTRIDGSAIPAAGSVRMATGRDVILGIGRADAELKMRVRCDRDSWGRPAGVSMERCDGARARIFIVWREIAVSSAETILWNGSCWCVARGADTMLPISIGTSVSLCGESFSVLPFRQTHLN